MKPRVALGDDDHQTDLDRPIPKRAFGMERDNRIMETTRGLANLDRRSPGRHRIHFDRLEPRLARSGLDLTDMTQLDRPDDAMPGESLAVVATSPGNSATVATSPGSLVVSFDRPLDDFSLGNADFVLEHVQPDGSTTPLRSGEARVFEALDSSSLDGNQIRLTLSRPLLPGRYRLELSSTASIQGLDGSLPQSSETDRTLTTFTVGQPVDGLDRTVELGSVGPVGTEKDGLLNLADNPAEVRYYRLTLLAEHHWRLGVAVSSEKPGASFAASLSLFDFQGKLVASTSTGADGTPSDPYLFAGVGPGTYFVGVSARKNIPDTAGVYDFSRGAIDRSDLGGPFRIRFVADPADRPAEVLGLRVDRANPLSEAPTGLTLAFSAPLRWNLLQVSGDEALVVVNSTGQTYALHPVHYDADRAELSVVFDRPLAPGAYRLRLAGGRTLLDLADQVPVAPGFASGTLGAFQVAVSSSMPADLGTLYPGLATPGIRQTIALGPDAETVRQFVVVEPGVYRLEGIKSDQGVRYSVLGAAGQVVTEGLEAPGDLGQDLTLAPGAYRIVLLNPRSSGIALDLTIQRKESLLSSLLDGGVGQRPALSLRLVAPQTDLGRFPSSNLSGQAGPISPRTAPPDSGQSSAVNLADPQSPGKVTPTDRSVSITKFAPEGPIVAGFLYGYGPVGRSSFQTTRASVVGPSGLSSLPAIATSEDGLPGGRSVVPESIDLGDPTEPIEAFQEPDLGPAASTGREPSPDLLKGTQPGQVADARALVQAEGFGQIVANVWNWLGRSLANPESAAPNSEAVDALVAASLESSPVEEDRLETASLTSPMALGVLLAWLGYHCRGKFQRRLDRTVRESPRPGVGKGPHDRLTRRSKSLDRRGASQPGRFETSV